MLPCHKFLSTLSLRRATGIKPILGKINTNFYPRSPCGERHISKARGKRVDRFLSTLSLRRATVPTGGLFFFDGHFYPRSPCGERLTEAQSEAVTTLISIHALLAESDTTRQVKQTCWAISIHALLAESDQHGSADDMCQNEFLSTLSLRRATRWNSTERPVESHFYPRSPCGERRLPTALRTPHHRFLSTLSLRRATNCTSIGRPKRLYFYPRSPCGERPK